MRILEAFVVYETTDEWGRLGKMCGVCRTMKEAQTFAKGKGYYGSMGRIQESAAIDLSGNLYLLASPTPVVFEDVKALQEAEKQAKLAAALAKLTPEEIELIKGVK